MTAFVEPSSGENFDRIIRVFARFTSFGYLAYAVLLSASIVEWTDLMDSWWTPFAVVATFGTGVVPGLLSFGREVRAARIACAVAAVGFLISLATWPLAWNGALIPDSDGIWLASIPGLVSIAAVLAWPAWAGLAHMVIGCVAAQSINVAARANAEPVSLLPEIAFAVMFCSLFVGGAVMALRTGRLLDSTTGQTHAAAQAAASQRAVLVERERFDALTHDGVIATLLVVSRSGDAQQTSALAAATLAELDEIRSGGRTDRPFTVDQAVVHLRTAATDADDRAEFVVQRAEAGDEPIPADVVWTMGGALSEALRNTIRHAGPEATARVAVAIDSDAVVAEVTDDGVGFDPGAVSSHRLGIAVSIRGRMGTLDGGSAEIDSAPGAGTRVRLEWRRR